MYTDNILVAIRFFRHLVNFNPDEFYVKLVAEKQVLGPILDVLLLTLPRDNLLSSACLDIFEFIRKENIKELVGHLVDNYREKLTALSYIETFRELVSINERNHHGFPAATMENLFMESEDEIGRRPPQVNGRMLEHIMDMDEEYWNGTSDDEEENQERPSESSSLGSASGPLSALVDYHSDEESDENGDVAMKSVAPEKSKDAAESGEGGEETKTTSQPQPVPILMSSKPPERLSEKRRREEDDDDDELGKMMQHKRRNSQSSIQNAAGAASILRKRSVSSGTPGPKKIDIRLPLALQSGAGQGSPGQNGGS